MTVVVTVLYVALTVLATATATGHIANPTRKDPPMFRRLYDRLHRTASDERSPDWCHRHNCHRNACPGPH